MRRILVTSPTHSDGKTTVAANLAIVIAQSGLPVAVIDADMHQPYLHKVLQRSNRRGMSSLFAQPPATLEEVSQPATISGLEMIGSGPIPPNPSELLGSVRMIEVLDLIAGENRTVVIDSPPVLSVTDAVLLSTLADGVVLVVKPGSTNMQALRQTVDQLRWVGANLIGIVLNDVPAKGSRYSYFTKGYYSYYHYGTNGYGKFAKNGKSKKTGQHLTEEIGTLLSPHVSIRSRTDASPTDLLAAGSSPADTTAKICSFLGVVDDAETYSLAIEVDNYCYNRRPKRSVDLEHQMRFCLAGAHAECPFYKTPVGQPDPIRPLPVQTPQPAAAAAVAKDRSRLEKQPRHPVNKPLTRPVALVSRSDWQKKLVWAAAITGLLAVMAVIMYFSFWARMDAHRRPRPGRAPAPAALPRHDLPQLGSPPRPRLLLRRRRPRLQRPHRRDPLRPRPCAAQEAGSQ
jgi:capsular exopolysaccharide synthesis family protein